MGLTPDSKTLSPCISICKLNEDSICLGCFRSMDEILDWQFMEVDQKKSVLVKCKSRSDALGD
ncbi:MAG: DUF1289 domain-containing protein [SAR92 bacterium MED-G29]|nr:DUF1289 domain-containing protein [Porticoccaceae bacterium]MBL6894079.1 DUF1289 domain-containing protein [Porticoccaceae bacterium]PDH32095.1 MAG: DUF1289 domain-containing protein [SAR92 bacterium MED-G29]